MLKRFVIRVYGICINADGEVLLTSECWKNTPMLKFPGGGLEWGEGIVDALKREFREELDSEIDIVEHFYTTDFFQLSAFNTDDQIISVYYLVQLKKSISSLVSPWTGDFPEEGVIQFHWVNPLVFGENAPLSFPIDRLVGLKLRNQN